MPEDFQAALDDAPGSLLDGADWLQRSPLAFEDADDLLDDAYGDHPLLQHRQQPDRSAAGPPKDRACQ